MPLFIPTHLLQQDLTSVPEGNEGNAIVRFMRRATGFGGKLTPEQKADEIISWLVRYRFMTLSGPDRASQVIAKFYGHEASTSKLFESEGMSMRDSLPWLKKDQVVAIRTFLIDRVHANKADPGAISASTKACLVRYFETVDKDRKPASVSTVPIGRNQQSLMRLSAFHMDDVFFDPDRSIARGQQGAFFAGVTSRGYAVGVKCIYLGGDAEAMAMRRLQVGGYLQVHYGKHPTPTWVVMPCYSGTLNELAPLFFAVPYAPRQGHNGGLRGARYILQHLLGELAFLHDEMHGLHQDIKSRNIFVSQKQRRFVLGDLGLASILSAGGDAAFGGFTAGYASPEQIAEIDRITPASDVFSLCVTALNSMLQDDPAVDYTWMVHHGDIPKPWGLFPYQQEETASAFAAWAHFSDHDESLQRLTEHFELTYQNRAPSSLRPYLQHFDRIDEVMVQLDAPLWEILRSGLHMNPKARPAARALQRRITISEADQALCAAVWGKMAPYSRPIAEEIIRLRSLIHGRP